MQCHLPVSFPDELLHSVIARYLGYVGAKSPISADAQNGNTAASATQKAQ